MNIGAVETNGALSDVMALDGAKHDPAVRNTQSGDGGEKAVSHEQLKGLVDDMQSYIDRMDVSLKYDTYGENHDKVAVAVVNKQTGEVIREIPSKEIQNLYMKMSELAGMIFNRQV